MKKNNKLWQKDWQLNSFVEAFETKDDIVLDQKLINYDITGSIAHALMLNKIDILDDKELDTLIVGLKIVYKLNQKGKFNLEMGDEDIHTKIENYLTDQYGDVGKKIHTGRSRNDQVLTALRLFTKAGLLEISGSLILLNTEFIKFAKDNMDTPMPGYTHMQKAMPYTVGGWAECFISAFNDDFRLLESALSLIDQSPLGSAAGFGVPLNLDKEYTAKMLGFGKVQENSLYTQTSRGKFESVVLAVLISVLTDLNRFASDVLLFTTSEFGFLEVDSSLCTGSSIMPQKKNTDIAELIRSKVHLLIGNYVQITGLSTNLISGYNRDLQDMKKPLMEGLETAGLTILASTLLIKGIKPNKEKLKKAMTPEIYATHKALSLTQKGVSFRDAYQKVGKDVGSGEGSQDIKANIPSNLDNLIKENEKFQKKLYEIKKNFESSINKLLEN